MADTVIRLLNELDGHLGLAVHRGEGSTDLWKREAVDLITRIRDTLSAMNGADLIAVERARQVTDEGYTPDHDDTHVRGELGRAAVAYIFAADTDGTDDVVARWFWPFDLDSFKSTDPIHNLVRAGAFVAAELDRLHRVR